MFIILLYRPAVKWFLDGMEISEKRTEFRQSDDGETYKLLLTNVTTEMHGKYSCVIKNDYGKIEDECTVTVNCKSHKIISVGIFLNSVCAQVNQRYENP